MENKATITIHEIRCALGCEVALGKMTQAEKERIEKLLNLDYREQEYNKKEEANFFQELKAFFDKWDLMIHANVGQMSRLEYIVGAFGNRCFYHPAGMNSITSDEISHLPKIAKRQRMFDRLKLNQSVHIDEVRPILKAITRVEQGSWCYVTDEEYKQMLDGLKAKMSNNEQI